jgi:flagellar protein FliO/FliZ
MSPTIAYLIKLAILIPLVGGLAWGSLWLWRRAQQGIGGAGRRERLVTLLDATPLGATAKLAVVEFEGRRLLLAVSRTGVQLVADGSAPAAPLPTTVSRFGD